MPRKKPQSNKRRELVSQEILERAAALFAERGFANTSLQDVAKALEISRTALYHYIGGKDELLEALVRGLSGDAERSLKKIVADPDLDPVEKLRTALRDMATRIAENPARFRLLLISEGDLPAKLAAEHQRSRRRIFDQLRAVVHDGIESGRFRLVDESVAAFGLLGMCNWVAWWYRPGRPAGAEPSEIAASLADLGVVSLLATPTRVPEGAAGVEHAIGLLRTDLDYLQRTLETGTKG